MLSPQQIADAIFWQHLSHAAYSQARVSRSKGNRSAAIGHQHRAALYSAMVRDIMGTESLVAAVAAAIQGE